MKVKKRNGIFEDMSFDKIKSRLKLLSTDLNSIDIDIVVQKVCNMIYDEIETIKLDELASQICIGMETIHYEYGILGGRIVISNNHKETPKKYSESVEIIQNELDILNPVLVDIVKKNSEYIDNIINSENDYNYDYFAYKTLERSYLIKNKNGKIVERIQYMLMRVSIGMHLDDLHNAIQSYKLMSEKYFTHATPTLYNSGTKNPQLLSCFLLGTEDSVEDIYDTVKNCALISKWAGGIGIHISNIRNNNSKIRSSNGNSNGIVPMCQVYNKLVKHINQSSKRNGSIAMYLEPHHGDIESFINLRKQHGNEDDRTRELFTALWISDLFMEKVKNKEKWHLFNPDECPGLETNFGKEYEKLYYKYVKENKFLKEINAVDLWKNIILAIIETGTPYILFKDNANRKTNQNNLGTIRSSNLCAEIIEYSDEKEYACCVLASIALPMFVENKTFNYNKLIETCNVLVKNLNKIIDINYYPVPETSISNKKHRPLGIGVQGLADTYIKMGFAFDSQEAMELNKLIFETIYYGTIKSSYQESLKYNSYSSFKGSHLSNGKFQFDLWNVKPTNRYDWETLRINIMKNGIRNSLLVALMPTASTSQILGNNECIEPYTSNIYSRRTLAGDFIVINTHLQKMLINIGIWNTKMKDNIIHNNGSIQNINNIPDNIKKMFKTSWELKQKVLVQQSIDRGPYVCQSQSLNLFFEDPTQSELTSALFYAWKNGLKTGCYYLRTRPSVRAQKFTINSDDFKNCDSCSG